MVTKINEFNIKKIFLLYTDQKYLSMKKPIEQKPANLLASIQPKPIMKGISKQTYKAVLINAFIIK